MKVLMIDDDVVLCDLTSEYLSIEGFQVDTCHTGNLGLVMAKKQTYDAIILDIMLPDISGLSVLKKLTHQINTPIIMLTAKGSDIDQVVGLEIGADDYINKPCNPKVLVSRIKAILKRSKKNQLSPASQNMTLGHLEINITARTAKINQKQLKLTSSEFSILALLVSHPGKAFSKQDICSNALGKQLTDFDRSLDVHICKLRTKLSAFKSSGIHLKTIYGFGYMLEHTHKNE
ncbi:MAG: response regulator transcription factor [Gammaproteobacteria bacterium]|nr:response regulator transcription factor [Gammaproteobacteria bacterium]